MYVIQKDLCDDSNLADLLPYICWQMDPPGNTSTPNLADEPSLANGLPPCELKIDASNTSTPNLADKPSLANGPHWVIEQRCFEYQDT